MEHVYKKECFEGLTKRSHASFLKPKEKEKRLIQIFTSILNIVDFFKQMQNFSIGSPHIEFRTQIQSLLH